MRNNQPVTNNEFLIAEDATLMSTTDPQSHISYANAAFVHVSGYSLDELQHQPHNLVRHPDMPPEAFADMWTTLKAGEPWSALVKNRRKNGDFYWVRANAIPIVRKGVVQGYMSVRTKPQAEEVRQATELYRAMHEGTATGVHLHKGVVFRSGFAGLGSFMQRISVRHRIRLNMLGLWATTACGIGLANTNWAQAVPMLGMSAGIFLAGNWLLERQFAKPIEELRQQALDMATGNNRTAMTVERVDEIGITMRAISQLGLMFRWLIDDVSQQVHSVRGAVEEIAKGNLDLSARTERSAANVQQTASFMEQMTSTVEHNAGTSAQATKLAQDSTETVNHGGEAMQKVSSVMGEIALSSNKMQDIIGTIDSIAFQTNILALNAAVEAARAGEQGRGFAVVAAEVRALSQRSAAAAKEIHTLISDCVRKVQSGTVLVASTQSEMEAIMQQVRNVSALTSQISAATREQHEGLLQANQSVGQMDAITQQNAALVEQSAAAAQSLETQTQRLVEAIRVFS